MQKTIRIGIELNHVIRNINKQIAKYYQKEYDADIDLDEIDYTSDIDEICKFKSTKEKISFMYENYPYEIFGMANEVDQMISRDLNLWIKQLENYEDYNVEIFFYSLKEFDITISSTYYFLSKIGSRVRKIIFPRSQDELMDYCDVIISANHKLLMTGDRDKVKVSISLPLNLNQEGDITYHSFKEFIKDVDKLNKIVETYEKKNDIKDKSIITKFTGWLKRKITRKKN